MKRGARTASQSEMRLAVYRVVLPAAAAIAASVVLMIPGYYETTTLWYKTGIDRAMLVAGQYCGLTALVLVYLQVMLAVRVTFLVRIFSEAVLIRWHRINGVIIIAAAVSHVLLVLVPEGISNLPVGWKFWPEMVGAALLLVIVLLAGTSWFRNHLSIPYKIWRAVHKPAGYLALLLVTIHALFVSESFERTGPRLFIALLFLTVAATWCVKTYRTARNTQSTQLHNRRKS